MDMYWLVLKMQRWKLDNVQVTGWTDKQGKIYMLQIIDPVFTGGGSLPTVTVVLIVEIWIWKSNAVEPVLNSQFREAWKLAA